MHRFFHWLGSLPGVLSILAIVAIAANTLFWSTAGLAASPEQEEQEEQEEQGQEVLVNEDKPFARSHIIMQVNDAEDSHHSAAVSIANNLISHYGGEDQVDIEIIAFGPGVSLLTADNNVNPGRITRLMQNGVRFYICGNTLDSIERQSGKRPQVLKGVREVRTGVAFLVEEMARGYQHVHP